MTQESVDRGKAAAETAAAALVAVAAAGIGGPIGAGFGALVSPAVMRVAGEAWNELLEHRRNSVAGMLQGAADKLGVDPEQVVVEAHGRADRFELFGEAMLASAETFNEMKVEALARAVANGLSGDKAVVARERLIVSALADLEAPHIKLLLFLKGARRRGRDPGALAVAAKMPTNTVHSVLAGLAQHGMVESDETRQRADIAEEQMQRAIERVEDLKFRIEHRQRLSWPRHVEEELPRVKPRWIITGFGRECAEYLTPKRRERPSEPT